tara:strand:- start:332 stop:616 length:285 start_codon:yes stop_codon:yes gene_type:complete
MRDIINQIVSPGDFFLIPGGNARYGGLTIEVGVVLSMTEKRLKTLIIRFDKTKLKPITKTPKKILKIELTESLLAQESVQMLVKAYKEFKENNA